MNETQGVILGIIGDRSLTGGQVFREMGEMTDFWSSTRSQVYRELPMMVGAGLLKDGKPGARGAVPYKITAKGRKSYKSWLAKEGKVLIQIGRAHV